VSWIIRRAAQLAPRWQELAADLDYGDPAGFYLYPAAGAAIATAGAPGARAQADGAAAGAGGANIQGQLPRPQEAGADSRLVPRTLELLGRLFPVTGDTWLRRLGRHAAAWAERRRPVARAVERLELAIKQPLFGCEACGNCVLGHMEYVCPQTCPKQLRNGPCGGTAFGRCEVADQPCIWTRVYARARAAGRVKALVQYIPPPDRSLAGSSSWINYFLERDSRPGRDAPPVMPGHRQGASPPPSSEATTRPARRTPDNHG
jgi:hypothetical protein